MGQKVNANSIRLGITNNWKDIVFMDSSKESINFTYKVKILKDYINYVLKKNKISVTDILVEKRNNNVYIYTHYIPNNYSFNMFEMPQIDRKTLLLNINKIFNKNKCYFYLIKPRKNLQKDFNLIKRKLNNFNKLPSFFKEKLPLFIESFNIRIQIYYL